MKYLLASFVFLSSVVAQAAYLKAGLGATLGGTVTATSGGLEAEVKQSNMMFFPVVAAYGYQLNDWLTLEGEISARAATYKDSQHSATAQNAMINAVFTIPFGEKWNGFGGIGAGYGHYDLSLDSDDGWAAGAQGFIGADYVLESQIRIGLEGRYFQSVQDIDLGNGVDAEYQNYALLFSAKFPF